MSARLISITSQHPRAGKTHFAAALARWLSSHGRSVEILHLGGGSASQLPAFDGSLISRSAVILAEASQVASGRRHEDPDALPQLAAAAEFVLIESAALPPPASSLTLQLSRGDGFHRLEDFGRLPSWSGPPLVPETPSDVAAMEPFRIGGWPRVGVVTLPYLANFSDFRILRGAEWFTVPPPGQFSAVFLPATSDPVSDQSWLDRQALLPWLAEQRRQGCRVISLGWKAPGAELMEIADFADHAKISRLVGRRLEPPLPEDQTYDRLAAWLGAWSRFKSLVQRIESTPIASSRW